MATDIKKIVDGLKTSVSEYDNATSDSDKLEKLTLIQKETGIILAVEKRAAEDHIAEERMQFEKDHAMTQDKEIDARIKLNKDQFDHTKIIEQGKIDLEKNRLEHQKNVDDQRNDLEIKRLENEKSFDQLKIDYERQKLEIEKQNLEIQNDIRKDNRKFQLISLGITAATTIIGFLIKLKLNRDYTKLAYANLKLIYIDEGRPTTEWKDAVKNVKDVTRI